MVGSDAKNRVLLLKEEEPLCVKNILPELNFCSVSE